MSIPHVFFKNFEGQVVMINMESKVLAVPIKSTLRHAKKVFNWDEEYGNLAFGINKSIMNFVIGAKMKLLVRHAEDPNSEYWINHDVLNDFKSKVNCLAYAKNTEIYNIPVSLFKSKPNFRRALQ